MQVTGSAHRKGTCQPESPGLSSKWALGDQRLFHQVPGCVHLIRKIFNTALKVSKPLFSSSWQSQQSTPTPALSPPSLGSSEPAGVKENLHTPRPLSATWFFRQSSSPGFPVFSVTHPECTSCLQIFIEHLPSASLLSWED